MVDNPSFATKFAIAQTVAAGSVTVAYPFDTVRRRLMMMSGEGEKMYKGSGSYDVHGVFEGRGVYQMMFMNKRLFGKSSGLICVAPRVVRTLL